MANTGSHPNPTQAVQDEFWVLRQLLNDNNCLPEVIRQHLDKMRHRTVGVVRSLLKEIEELEDELEGQQ